MGKDLSEQLHEAYILSQEHSRESMHNMQVDAMNRQHHFDLMNIENQKLQSYNALLRQIERNNEATRKEFEQQERKTKRRFMITTIISAIAALASIAAVIVPIIFATSN